MQFFFFSQEIEVYTRIAINLIKIHMVSRRPSVFRKYESPRSHAISSTISVALNSYIYIYIRLFARNIILLETKRNIPLIFNLWPSRVERQNMLVEGSSLLISPRAHSFKNITLYHQIRAR